MYFNIKLKPISRPGATNKAVKPVFKQAQLT